MQHFPLPAAQLAALQASVQQPILSDIADCFVYAYDNSRKISLPQAVVFPLNHAEVCAVVRCCNQYQLTFVARGRGTGTAGGSIPVAGGVVISLEKMRRIITLDTDNRLMCVEAGVLNQEVQKAVQPAGFFWPPDPSSAAYCSIGGNLATNAGGPHAVKYGVTRDHVLGLRAVTAAGESIRTGCYTTKGVVGYDLTRLLIGSEGTLAIITEATLKLTPLPTIRTGLVASFGDEASCAAAIVAIMRQSQIPAALEFLDAGALDLIRGRHPQLLPADAKALLMLEIDGNDAGSVAASRAALAEAAQTQGTLAIHTMNDPEELWAARKALSPLLKEIAPKKINEDVAVPICALPALLQGLRSLTSHYQLHNINFGHAGNGNIHVNLLVNPDHPAEMQRAEACLSEIFDLVLRLQGTLSGEHGVGQEKRAFVNREIDAPTLQLMRQIKQTFDPLQLLNRGKVLPDASGEESYSG